MTTRDQNSDENAAFAPPHDWQPVYTPWRHGGWYVSNITYPSGAVGCVSNHYPDGQWRIVCDARRGNLGEPGDVTFPTREAAARAEYALAQAQQIAQEDRQVQTQAPARPRG